MLKQNDLPIPKRRGKLQKMGIRTEKVAKSLDFSQIIRIFAPELERRYNYVYMHS